jgi:hypothetical protein
VGARRLAVVALFGAVVLLVVGGIAATVFVKDGPPTCPLGSLWQSETPSICAIPLNQPRAGSEFKVVDVAVDHKTTERALIVGIAALGAAFVVALALRLLSKETREGTVEHPIEGESR